MKRKNIFLLIATLCLAANISAQQTDTLKNVPGQVSIVYPLGTNGRQSYNNSYNFSLNLLTGKIGGLSGLEISGLYSQVKKDVSGVQIAGLGNIVGGRMSGLQISGLAGIIGDGMSGLQVSGLASIVGDGMSGLQVSGLASIIGDGMSGLQVAGFASIVGDGMKGMQVAGITSIAGDNIVGLQVSGIASIVGDGIKGLLVAGLQVSGITSIAGDNIAGLQVSGLASITSDRMSGLQVSGLSSITGDRMKGLQVSGIASIVGDRMKGLQVSGIASIAGDRMKGLQVSGIASIVGNRMKGLQVSGIASIAGNRMNGVQIGLYNKTRTSNGLQIGLVSVNDTLAQGISLSLINIVKKGAFREWELSFADYDNVALTFKMGTQKFYTLYSAGINVFTDNLWNFGIGFGNRTPMSKKFDFQPELIYSNYFPINFKNIQNISVSRLKLGFVYNISEKFGMSLAPSVYFCNMDKNKKSDSQFKKFSPFSALSTHKNGNEQTTIGLGISLGLSIK